MNKDVVEEVFACGDCRFWQEKGREMGACCRYAPRALAFEDGGYTDVRGHFPETWVNEWCGEFVKGKALGDAT